MKIKKLEEEKNYPATHIVHWPTGPVPCCEKHAKGLVGLANMLGSHVGVTINLDTSLKCTNCINEAK